MAGGGDEAQAESPQVVEGGVEGVDLQPAAVAGARVDLPDREAATEVAARRLLQPGRELGEASLGGRRRRLGQGRLQDALEQKLAHGPLRGRGPNRNS